MDTRKRSSASRSDSNGYPGPKFGSQFSDPEGYVDDIPEEELLTDILKDRPGEDTGMESVVIIDNIPVAPAEKLEKLKSVVRKLIITHVKIAAEDIVNEVFPVEENGSNKGFAFYEFTNGAIAERTKTVLDGFRFDKQHTLAIDFFMDFEKYINQSDEWEEPTGRVFKDPGNLRWWLEKEDAYDQYIVICGGPSGTDSAAVFENSPVEPLLLEQREHWTDRLAMWSPLGTYLATFHQKGVALWVGKEFKQFTKFSQNDVVTAGFSPKERYILTVRNKPEHLPVDDQSMILWDVVTSTKLRSFPWDRRETPPADTVKWSADEKFYALLSKETVNVYEAENVISNKTFHEIKEVADFSWSPSQSHLAFWVREQGENVPARLSMVGFPDKNDLRTKQLFHVLDCQFVWQKGGEYMAVKVNRYKSAKKKKHGGVDYTGHYFNLEIFNLTNAKKEVPVESIEIKDAIIDLAWEPNGSMLVLLTTADAVTSVSFYSGRLGKQFELVKKLPLRHKVERISWSPMGQFVTLYSTTGSVGYLTFIDTADLTIMADLEHFLLSEVQWDPTGRYLTAVTKGNNKKDNGYTIYSFQGRYVRNEKVDGLSVFSWRPRPQTLLSADKQKEIRKNLKKYAPDFEAKDKQLLNKASREVSERRMRQMDAFMERLERTQRAFELRRAYRVELRGGVDTDAQPDQLEEETLEVIVNTTRTSLE